MVLNYILIGCPWTYMASWHTIGKLVSRTSWKCPSVSCIWYQAPEKLHFFQPPSKRPAHPEPFARLFGRHLEIFSQILMKHLGGGLARTWYILINRTLLLNWHWKMNYYTSMPFKLYWRFFYSRFMRYLHIERLEFTHVVVSHSNLLRKKKAFTPT